MNHLPQDCRLGGCRFCAILPPPSLVEESNTMQSGSYVRRDYKPIRFVRGRSYEQMRLAKPDDNKHIVIVKRARRDEKTGKMIYETVESFDVFESNDKEVQAAVIAGLTKAATGK